MALSRTIETGRALLVTSVGEEHCESPTVGGNGVYILRGWFFRKASGNMAFIMSMSCSRQRQQLPSDAELG